MIKSIKLKNFQSWPELEFEVSDGICLVKGYNHDDNTSEGAGKSSILNAMCWGLFGEIPKDTKVDDVIKQGEKSCEVIIKLSDGYTIERRRKPNDLALWSPSAAHSIRGKDARETQKLIEKHIGFTYETFLQSVYFAQNSLVKFLLLNEDGKAKILSNIANTDIFDSARKKAHDIAREAFMKLSIEKNKLSDLDNTIKLMKEQINSLRDVRLKFESERLKAIGMLELKKEDLGCQIGAIGYIPILSNDYYIKLEELKSTANKYRESAMHLKVQLSQQAERQMRKNSLEKEIKDIKTELQNVEQNKIDSKCDSCGSSLHNEAKHLYIKHKNVILEQKVKELQDLKFTPTQKIEEEYNFYTSTLVTIEQDLRDVQVIEMEVKHKKEKLNMLTEQYNKCEEDLKNQKVKEYPDIDKRVELLQTSLYQKETERDNLASNIADLIEKQHTYETLKDGFKEVKSLAFQDTINELNVRSNYYLAELFEQDVKIKFTNQSDNGEVSKIETLLLINGEPRLLGLFSGGQTRRIMLAVDLAISDIIHSRGGRKDKLLILDEYFKDLSEESLLKVCKLLTNIKGSIILVEHNSIINTLASNVFEIEYKNGESFKV